jgi:hypothetical protein
LAVRIREIKFTSAIGDRSKGECFSRIHREYLPCGI